ncbi:DNA polymerase [Albimonas donghaensis]|uniref:Type-4 uracil-DNA glycosylase n=1 Tax=Albimonas donghaensis TaxID=356660 RepID=A0A1H2QYC3_9RHOB|nr:uracil-DNA glycosylase [Albimonas donghaensis]SDW12153.1 DNA polymerase [Albimonas donghaensis]
MDQGTEIGGWRRDGTGGDAWAAAGREALLAALEFQVECGVDEAVAEAPVDRFAESAALAAARAAARAATPAAAAQPGSKARKPAVPRPEPEAEPREVARALAAAASDLSALHDAIRGFEGSPLKKGARNTVICDGRPGARVMIVGEAPGREEDREGKPFVGRSGVLLDRMLAAIGLARDAATPADSVYITNVAFWRPIENRRPSTDEVSMLLPFTERHIELAAPDFVLLMGAAPSQGLLDTTVGITRLRGIWRDWRGVPVLPTFHPAYLLRTPERKRDSWRDLRALRAALDGAAPEIGA